MLLPKSFGLFSDIDKGNRIQQWGLQASTYLHHIHVNNATILLIFMVKETILSQI